MSSVSKVFSQRTLGEFEAASASIPLRRLEGAFARASIPLGDDPGGPAGARRIQFRRYIASVDQRDAQQLARLGDALGALIKEVATSKVDFLVKAAERDGFFFADGVFRPVGTAPSSFAVTRIEDLASIEDLGRLLHLLANDSPKDALDGANELLESVCRTVLRTIGEPAPAEATGLVDIDTPTVRALERLSEALDDAKNGAALVRRCLQQLGAVVLTLGELRSVYGSDDRHEGEWNDFLPCQARLGVGAAVTIAAFVAETYVERATTKND
jgi:hypothetical protein